MSVIMLLCLLLCYYVFKLLFCLLLCYHTFKANRLRIFIYAAAYILMHSIRERGK